MMAAATMASAPSTTLAMFCAARALQFAEEHAAPENADQRVGVPERKGDRQADVADGEDGEGVGDSPEHSGKDGDGNQVPVFGQIGEDVARALQHGGHGPASGEDAGDHAERDRVRRQAGVDQLGGRFGRAKPHARSQPAQHAEAMNRGKDYREDWFEPSSPSS